MHSTLRGLSYVVFAALLTGCPQGAGEFPFRQDGGDEADADAALEADADPDAEPSDAAAAGPGALCGVDGRDECGSYAICDPLLGCVECVGDDDCPSAAAHCLLGACVGCRPGLSDCQEGTACSSADFECHPRCDVSGSCDEGTACEKMSGECVGCSALLACADGVCSMPQRRCVECVDDATCGGATPRCRVALGTCVACLSNDDCGVKAPTCDPATFTCRAGEPSDAPDGGQ